MSNATCNAVSHTVSNSAVTVTPTRPDPTRPEVYLWLLSLPARKTVNVREAVSS